MSSKGGKGAANDLAAEGKQLFAEGTPVRRQLLDQQSTLLKTGGTPQAQVPVIQRAVEAQRQAQTQGLRNTQEQIGSAGIRGNDPFSQGIMANTRAVGDVATAAIPSSISQGILSSAPNLAMGFPQLAGGNLGNASQSLNAKGGGKSGLLG